MRKGHSHGDNAADIRVKGANRNHEQAERNTKEHGNSQTEWDQKDSPGEVEFTPKNGKDSYDEDGFDKKIKNNFCHGVGNESLWWNFKFHEDCTASIEASLGSGEGSGESAPNDLPYHDKGGIGNSGASDINQLLGCHVIPCCGACDRRQEDPDITQIRLPVCRLEIPHEQHADEFPAAPNISEYSEDELQRISQRRFRRIGGHGKVHK